MLDFFHASILYFSIFIHRRVLRQNLVLVRHPSTITITKSSSRWWFLRFDLEKNSEKNLSDKISAWRLAKFPCSYVHFFETKNYEIVSKDQKSN